jgi:hypothetical protein
LDKLISFRVLHQEATETTKGLGKQALMFNSLRAFQISVANRDYHQLSRLVGRRRDIRGVDNPDLLLSRKDRRASKFSGPGSL